MTVYCEDCEHKIDAKTPRYWTCIKHPLHETNFVSRSIRLQEPYLYCKSINRTGSCPDFEKTKTLIEGK